MDDPRKREIFERQCHSVAKKIERLMASEVSVEDSRMQTIAEREAQISSKRKSQQQEVIDQNSAAKPQTVPQDIKDDFEEYVALQRSLDAVKPSASSDVKTKTPSTSTTFSVGSPDKNKGLPPLYVCAAQLKERVPLILYQDCLFAYNGRCYDLLSSSDEVIRLYRAKVDHQFGGEKTLGCIKQLFHCLLTDSDIPVKKVNQNQRIAVLRNGIYDVMTGQLRRHNPKEITFSWVNAEYLDYSKCRHFRKFLRDVTNGDETLQERIWQSLGYILTQSTEAKTFFLMGTAPNSGKSLLGNFIESLFDESYVSNVPLNAFYRSFEFAPIAGKAINVSLDLPATRLNVDAVSALKQLTGGDAVPINPKYEKPFRYRSRAKLLFATNFPLELTSRDDAFWDRVVYLPFDHSIPKERQDPMLPELFQQERDAIASEALRHTKALIENNFQFPTTPLIERRMEEWQGRMNPSIESFLYDCCILDADYRGELVDTLFSAYERYCDSAGFAAKSRPFFKQFLENEVGLKHCKLRDGGENPQSAFRGLKLKERYL